MQKYTSNLTAISMALPLSLSLSICSFSLSLSGCRLRILCWLRSVIELHFGLLYAGDIGALADTKKREKKEIEMGE